ncbi:MAG: hypothetical protein DMF84_28905 [Acidobacteria bacterium]|nr:MAG: hypothetical protein DMF84_28905 [Acidobacteriota bacterium]
MKVQKLVATVVCASAWLLVAACGDRSMPTSPDSRFDSNGITVMHDGGTTSGASSSGSTSATTMNPAWTSSSSSSGGTVKETLTGPAINGVTPRGLATADESNFSSGGSTILTVQVRDVNLRDGTVLGVTLDFTPVGSITLAGRQGTMTANLGHFGVSRDQVRVKNGDAQILIGGFFQ